MKITVTLLMFLVLLLPTAHPEEYTQVNLPEGAVARFGKGFVREIRYSPDGTHLAVFSTIGACSMIQRPIERLPCSPRMQVGTVV